MNDYRDSSKQIELSDRILEIFAEAKSRFRSRGEREGTETGPEADGKTPFLDAFESMPDEPYVVCLAQAIVNSWLVSDPVIYHNDIIVGVPRPFRPLVEHFHWGICEADKHLDAPAYKEHAAEIRERIKKQKKRLFPLSWSHMEPGYNEAFTEEQTKNIGRLFWGGGYQGHTVPDYFRLLRDGIGGTLERVRAYEANTEDPKKLALYRAMTILLEGFTAYACKYAEAAEEMAAHSEGEARERFTAIAANCRSISADRPKTLYQAAQLVWFYSLWDWVDCVGRFDQYMYPFYEKSVRDGDKFPPEDIVAAIFVKFSEHGVHNLPLGGVDPRTGEDATNDLSFLVLQIGRVFHTVHPRMVARIDEHTPPAFMKLIVKMWSEGMSDPTLASDPLIIEGLREYGVSLEDARSYTTLGCQEIEIPGKSNFGCEDGAFNLAKIFEYTINDGCDRFSGVKMGLSTGHLANFKNIDEVWDAFIEQMKHFIPPYLRICNLGQEIRAANASKLVKSIFTDDCIARGLHMDEGGAMYGYGVIETAGASAAADSFAAVDKLVFREKKISPETLEAAIAANFEGYEKERQLLLNQAPKYGNDDPLADEYMCRILDAFWGEIGKYRSVRGGVFTGACSLLTGGISFGEKTWALPDGRFKGEPLGNTIGPRTGADHCGVTAMLTSVMKLPLKKGIGGTTLNVLIPCDMTKTEEQREKIEAIMTAYMMEGGQMAQITTANLADMLDAKVHPERHGDLIVRVGGYSAFFVEMDPVSQDEIIKRYGAAK